MLNGKKYRTENHCHYLSNVEQFSNDNREIKDNRARTNFRTVRDKKETRARAWIGA